MMNSWTTSATGSGRSPGAAFTMVEILIVIAVIAILASIVITLRPAAMRAAFKAQAKKEINEIASALESYHADHHAYPPDTADWGSFGGYDERPFVPPELPQDLLVADEFSIHRYLCTEITSPSTGRKFQYLGIDDSRLERDSGVADAPGRYLDPWREKPYQVDAVHVYFNKAQAKWKPCGWPYSGGGALEPTAEQKAVMTRAFKIVSYGPDCLSAEYPFDPGEEGGGEAEDDIRSW